MTTLTNLDNLDNNRNSFSKRFEPKPVIIFNREIEELLINAIFYNAENLQVGQNGAYAQKAAYYSGVRHTVRADVAVTVSNQSGEPLIRITNAKIIVAIDEPPYQGRQVKTELPFWSEKKVRETEQYLSGLLKNVIV